MNHLPVIRIELDGVRHTVNAMLQTRNDELNAMVLASLEKQITAEWVQQSIDENVHKCIHNAIASVADDWRLKSAITDVICEVISQKFKRD